MSGLVLKDSVIINGGDKSKQAKDIEKAQELLEQWRLKK